MIIELLQWNIISMLGIKIFLFLYFMHCFALMLESYLYQ